MAQCRLVAGKAGWVKAARKNQRSSRFRFITAFLNSSKTIFLTKIKKDISINKWVFDIDNIRNIDMERMLLMFGRRPWSAWSASDAKVP